MNVLNFGSLNIDHVYRVERIAQPGETIDSLRVDVFPGGKGMNQSIALARAGCQTYHAGNIGTDGQFLRELLQENGVDCTWLRTVSVGSGSTFIQVDAEGQNCIVLNGGANRANTREYVDQVLNEFGEGDLLLLQNEINELDYMMKRAVEKGMTVVLNPSPMNAKLLACDLSRVSLFLLNEGEAMAITGEQQLDRILLTMRDRYPAAQVLLTLGSRGAVYQGNGKTVYQQACAVRAVDTTAAGDTFTGYFLAGLARGDEIERCLSDSVRAAAIAVTRPGAATSIPLRCEVEAAELSLRDETCGITF